MFVFNHKKGLSVLVSSLLTLCMLCTSCGDFLDIKPYGRTVPKTTEEYQALVTEMLTAIDGTNTGETGAGALFFNNEMVRSFETYGDNMETSLTSPSSNMAYYVGNLLGTNEASVYYERFYRVISRCNIILDNYETGRDTENGQQLIGACYALRGLAYYQLLRMYCEPVGAAAKPLGVPIVTGFDMEAKPNRSSYEETFKQVESDFKTAMSKNIKNDVYLFTPEIVKGLLARLYFWTGHFAEAKQYADQLIAAHPLLSGEDYKKMEEAVDGLAGNMLLRCDRSPVSGHAFSYLNPYFMERPLCARFVKLFAEKDKDIRYTLYFNKRRLNNKRFFSGLRTAEFYLISMESAYHLGDRTEALRMLNEFRAHRISPYTAYAMGTLPPVDADENIKVDCTGAALTPLMQAILNERRKELYLEGDRFFELKRNGRPEFWATSNGLKYTTEKFMYTFPLPPADLQVNPGLVQNPGYTEVLYN